MNRYASLAAAILLLTATCTAGAWQRWEQGWYADGSSDSVPSGQRLDRSDLTYKSQYAADTAEDPGFGQGFYGWSYLLASPVASPIATTRTVVRNDPR